MRTYLQIVGILLLSSGWARAHERASPLELAAKVYDAALACEGNLQPGGLDLAGLRALDWREPHQVLARIAAAPAGQRLSGEPGRRGAPFLFAFRGENRLDDLGPGIVLFLVHQSGPLAGFESRNLIDKFYFEIWARVFYELPERVPNPLVKRTSALRLYQPTVHEYLAANGKKETANLAEFWIDPRQVSREDFLQLAEGLRRAYATVREDHGF